MDTVRLVLGLSCGFESQLAEQRGGPLLSQASAGTAHAAQRLLLEAVICTPLLHKSNELKDKGKMSLNLITVFTSKGSCDLSLVNIRALTVPLILTLKDVVVVPGLSLTLIFLICFSLASAQPQYCTSHQSTSSISSHTTSY